MVPIKKKFKPQPTAGKVMFTLFWDSQGSLPEHYQNSAHHSEMKHKKLELVIQIKQQGELS
jgi:hypothetical protein